MHYFKIFLLNTVDRILPAASVLLAATLLFVCNVSFALINGLMYPPVTVSTVKILLHHEHYLRSIEQWEYYDSTCSAAVVGIKPLTLVTSAHCLKEIKLIGANKLPQIEIMHPELSGISDAQITKAFYQPYEVVVNDITQDIAVLVFDAILSANLIPLKIGYQTNQSAKTLLLCGFGKGYQEIDAPQPRCAERNVVKNSSDFNEILPQSYQPLDEMLHLKAKAQFEYTKELVHYEQALLAINRLDEKSSYSNKLPMATLGDSGGPWLSKTSSGNYQVVAITSLVESFYNKSRYWSFFDRDAPLSEYSYVAYGLRLDHPKVLQFLKQAHQNGADIMF